MLLTHGHLDHTFSVAPVCGARGITAYVHPADREMLADPAKGLSHRPRRSCSAGGCTYTEPDDVGRLHRRRRDLTLAGLEITVDHAPGHTGGSVLFRLPGARRSRPGEPRSRAVPLRRRALRRLDRAHRPAGRRCREMLASLRDKILPLADDTVVLPGHGPATTIGRERATNPYLREVIDRRAPARLVVRRPLIGRMP